MQNQKWKEYDSLAFFIENPVELRSLFLERMEYFANNTSNYEHFIMACFDNIIRKDLHPTGLDIRKILEFYEPFACSSVFESLKEMSK